MKIHNSIFPLALLLLSCGISALKDIEISPKSSIKYMYKPPDEVIFVDLRSKEEYETSHIPGAINIDYFSPNYQEELSKIPKNKTIVLYCKYGLRSKNAAQLLKTLGYPRVHSLEGGFLEWEKTGLPVERNEK